MTRVQKDVAVRVLEVMNAWEKMRPHRPFYGLTLEEFKLRAKPWAQSPC